MVAKFLPSDLAIQNALFKTDLWSMYQLGGPHKVGGSKIPMEQGLQQGSSHAP